MPGVEWVRDGDQVVGLILRRDVNPTSTTFLTPDTFTQQVGLIVYPKGGRVMPHAHLPIERRITGTTEVLLVRRGAASVDFYDASRRLVCTRAVGEGDILLLVTGGHGIRFTEDTVLVEIKQGPYAGVDDKVRFEP